MISENRAFEEWEKTVKPMKVGNTCSALTWTCLLYTKALENQAGYHFSSERGVTQLLENNEAQTPPLATAMVLTC